MNKDTFHSSDKPYHDFYSLLKTITDKYAPIKQKKVRDNKASFMTKELRKAIMDRSLLWNEYLKYPSREHFVNIKKMKSKCNSICRKFKIKYLKIVQKRGFLQVNSFGILLSSF